MLLLIPALLGLLVGGGAAVVVAQEAGVIDACVDARSGAVRIVTRLSKADACREDERPLRWGVQGPPGSQGAAGSQGLPGPQGLTGPQGAGGAPVAAA